MKRNLFFTILVVCIAIMSSCTSMSKTADDYYAEAEIYKEQGDYEKAIQAYTEVIKRQPDTIYYLTRANMYYEMVNQKFNATYLNNAKSDYEMGIKLAPNTAAGSALGQEMVKHARTRLSEIKIRQNPNIRSREMVLEGVEGITIQGEEIGTTYSIVALAYAQEKLFDKAINYCTDGLELKPNDQNLLAVRAYCYKEIKKYDKAIADYTTAIELYPNEDGLYEGRGATYLQMENFDKEALADFNTAIKINPKNIDALNNRGVLYMLNGDFDKAIADCNTVLRMDPNNAGAKKLTAYIQQQKNKKQ